MDFIRDQFPDYITRNKRLLNSAGCVVSNTGRGYRYEDVVGWIDSNHDFYRCDGYMEAVMRLKNHFGIG